MAFRLYIKIIFSTSALLSAPVIAISDFEAWKMQQQQGMQQQKSEFQQYRDARDREFTDFLKQQWKGVSLLHGFVRDENPKPVVMPVAKPEPVKVPVTQPLPKPIIPEPDITPAIVKPEPVVIPPQPDKPAPVTVEIQKGSRARIDYFGTGVSFYYDPKLKQSLSARLNETAVSNFWSELSRADYEPLLSQLDKQADALLLNDWGYALLVHKLSAAIYPSSSNRQALLTWFILTKAGYRSRIAYSENKVYLLMPSRHQLYDTPFFTFDNQRYYAVSLDSTIHKPGRVYTYDGHYPGADRKLDMRLDNKATQGEHVNTRNLRFEFAGNDYEIDVAYEKSRVDFLNTYPQLDLELYFDSKVGNTTASPLLDQLSVAIEGMGEQEAVNFLLRFVQTSLKYKTDERQFGQENYLFPEETIYYPYSDCEDRSVLFAWLVRRLLGLEVVGLSYPGHVATAVHLKQSTGDYIVHEGKRFSVADPTYVNARAGMTMPEYRNTRPDVITIQ